MSWEDYKKQREEQSSWEQYKKQRENQASSSQISDSPVNSITRKSGERLLNNLPYKSRITSPKVVQRDTSLLERTKNFTSDISNKISGGVNNTTKKIANASLNFAENKRINNEYEKYKTPTNNIEEQQLAMRQAVKQSINDEQEVARKNSIESYNQAKKEREAQALVSDEKLLENLSKLPGHQRVAEIYNITKNNEDFNRLNNQVIQYQMMQKSNKKANKINEDMANGNYLSAIGHVAAGVPIKAKDSLTTTMASINSLADAAGIVKVPTNSYIKPSGDDLIKTNKVVTSEYGQTTSQINNGAIRTAANVSGTLGAMAPSIAASMILPGAGRVLQGVQVGADSYQENLNDDGSNRLRSVLTGAAKGYTSYAIEGLSGGNILSGGSLDDWAVKTIASKTSNKSLQKLASMVYEVGGEILEEEVENNVDYVIDKVINNKELPDFKEWWNETSETAKQTVLSTLALKVLGLGGNTYKDVQEYSQNAEMNKWIGEAEKIIEKENLKIDSEKLQQKNNINELLSQLAQNEQNTTTQQITPTIQNNAQNGISEQTNSMLNNKEVPMLNYQYEKSDNVKINNLRQDANKYFNNSEKARNYVSMLERIIADKNIDIRLDADLKTPDGKIANGSYSNGVITINPNSTRTGEFIAVHELTHAIGTDSMKNIIETYRKSNPEFNTAVEKLLQNYNSSEITEEALSDVSAQLFGNQEFINNVAQTNPNIFKKIYSEIKYLWHQFRGYKNQDQFVEDLYYKWTQAYNSSNKLNNTSNYSIAGKQGMINAIKADTGNLQLERNYNKAQQMQTNGINNETIRQATGWFQDKTGDWKFEFSDKDMSLKNIKLEKNKTYKLGDLLEHDTLFTVYPELANYNVKFENIGTSGAFRKSEKLIRINSDKLNLKNSKIAIEGTMIHEIQHAIQSIEGFEEGFTTQLSKLDYFNRLGEIEADDTKRRYILEKNGKLDRTIIEPESAKSNPKHSNLNNYLKNRKLLDKMKDSVYNYFNNKNQKGGDSYEIYQDDMEQINEENGQNLFQDRQDYNRKIWDRLEENKKNGDKYEIENIANVGASNEKNIFQNNRKDRGIYRDRIDNNANESENNSGSFSLPKINSVTDIENKYKDKVKYLILNENENTININNIVVKEELRNKGIGQNILNDIIDYANKNNKTITLTPTSEFNTKDRLKKWYKKNGFVENKGKNTDFLISDTMYKIPDVSNERFSQQTTEWSKYLEKYYKATGTRTNLQDIKNIAPIAKDVKNNTTIKNISNIQIQQEKVKAPFRTSEQIANDTKISDIDAIKEESNKINTPTREIALQTENDISSKASRQTVTSPTIDLINKKRSKEKATITEIKDTLAQKFVNKGHYIDKLAKETENKNLTYLYDRTMTAFTEAQVSIGDRQIITNEKGTDVEEVGKSIIDIFSEADNANLSNEFDDYLLNKHNIARYAHEKGIFGSEISATDSQNIVDSYEKQHPEFIKWSQEVSEYNDNNLKDLVRNGLVSKETYENLRTMYKDYVPTFRDITDNVQQYIDDKVGNNTLGKATQSDKTILSVKESMAEQTIATKKAIRMNNLGVELYKTLGKGSKVNESISGIDFDPVAIQTLAGDVIDKATDGTNTFMIFQDGEMTQFKISDELYSAFAKDNLQNKINNSKAAKAMLTPVEKLSKAQRELLTTYSIGFAFNNPIKDFQDALFNTKYSSVQFFKNYTKALYNIGTEGSWYESYKNNGGTANTYFDYEKGILPSKNKKFGDNIKTLNNILEQAPRLAEYISTIENGGSIDEALYNAADITTNFKRGGDITKVANKYGANFLNASVQGLDKFYRNLSGQNGWKGYANLVVKSIVWQVAPAIINGLLLGDDEDYEDLPEYTKDNYFLFKIGDGKFFRIPKGRPSSVVGGIARRVLETAEGKEVDWKSLVDTTINQMAPNNPLTDNLVAPIMQASKNKTWYGGEIVSSRLQKLPNVEQYDESTDEVSKWIAKQVDKLPEKAKKTLSNLPVINKGYDIVTSPKKLNYVFDQYSGGAGDVILPMLTPQAENNILEDKFTTDSVMKNKHVSEYYSQLEELEKNKNSEKSTDIDQLKYMYLSGSSKELGELYQQKRDIQNSDLSDKEKKTQVREIQKQINDIVENKLENVDSIQKSGDTAIIGEEKYYKYKDEWKQLSEEEAKKIKGISLNTYANYQNKVATLSDAKKKKDESVTQKDKINILTNSNYTTSEKDKIYTQIINTDDDTYQILKKLDGSKNIINQYLDYLQADLKADREDDGTEKGKVISGSKKQKVYNYINSIDSKDMSYVQKLYLAGINTTLSASEKKKLFTYINENKSLTSKEKLEALDKLQGFTIYKDGKVTW